MKRVQRVKALNVVSEKHIKKIDKKLWWILFIIIAITGLLFFGNIKSAAKEANVEPPKARAAEVVEQTDNTNVEVIPAPPPAAPKPKIKTQNKSVNLKSDTPADPEKIKAYLVSLDSPLANYSDEIARSEFWSLLIGICYIEQYHCSRAPGNNYWGMMKPGGGLRTFKDLPEAINFMDDYFTKLYQNKKTVESLRGYYCASECSNWEPTVKKIKALVEAL